MPLNSTSRCSTAWSCRVFATPMPVTACFFFFYAITAHDTPRAVPIAARMADARFHRNLINLDLFSCVITLIF